MIRSMFTLSVVMAALAGSAEAQQPVRQTAPRPTRSYRSYSVTPAPRGEVAPGSRHANEATWRHAGAKPAGHYGAGR